MTHNIKKLTISIYKKTHFNFKKIEKEILLYQRLMIRGQIVKEGKIRRKRKCLNLIKNYVVIRI